MFGVLELRDHRVMGASWRSHPFFWKLPHQYPYSGPACGMYFPEGPSTQSLRCPVPRTIPSNRHLNVWMLRPSWINIRILHFGSKAQQGEDSSDHDFQNPCFWVVFRAPIVYQLCEISQDGLQVKHHEALVPFRGFFHGHA